MEEEEPVAEECLLVPLVMGLGRTRAKDRLLAVRASVLSCNVTDTWNRKLTLCSFCKSNVAVWSKNIAIELS